MSHELDQSTNADGVVVTSFASAVQHAWHRLGTVLPSKMTAQEALVAANLHNWNVHKSPLTTTVLSESGVSTIEVPGQYATVRTNHVTGGHDVLGVVGEQYSVLQNEQSFDILDTIVSESGAHFETAGAIRGGRQTFVSMKLPESISLVTPNGKRDVTDVYVIAMNSHDGSSSAKLVISPVRVVCSNTQAMALASAVSSYSFRHIGDLAPKTAEVRRALGMTFTYVEAFETAMQTMINRDINDVQAERLLKTVFTGDLGAIDVEFSTRRENQFEAIMDLYRNSSTIADVRGTRYGLYNAVTEWSDHFQAVQGGGDAEYRRAERVVLGQSGAFKRKAFAVLAK